MSKKRIGDYKVTKKVQSKTGKAERKRQAQSGETAGEQVPEQVPQEPAGATKGREHTVAASMPPRTTKAVETPAPEPTPDDAGELVVFAFRLTRAERDLIHAAAGSAKASKFVRDLAVAAAQGDGPTVLGILDRVQAK